MPCDDSKPAAAGRRKWTRRPQRLRCACALRVGVVLLLGALGCVIDAVAAAASYASLSSGQVHGLLNELYVNGELVELERVAQQVIQENPRVLRDVTYPSAFQYLGVAQYALGDLVKATATFEEAVRVNDDDASSWVHLGNCYMYQLQLAKATAALETAVFRKGATAELHQLFKARNWMADWRDRDDFLPQIETRVERTLRENTGTALAGLDFVELPAWMVMEMSRQRERTAAASTTERFCCDDEQTGDRSNGSDGLHPLRMRSRKLRVGFVSSDFGVHPVVTLMRGMLAMLTREEHEIEVFCFPLTGASSWWKRNITRTVDRMISLSGKNPLEAAKIIRSHHVHVLIDLNGHTLHSGLPIFAHRPAPVQISFLGYPMTTGSAAIDFFITDRVSSPVETSTDYFTEKLLVLPTHYIVNDHMQMLGHTLNSARPPSLTAVGAELEEPWDDPNVFVFATFSNWQKMDPYIFSAWMAILARVPSSVMWFLRYHAHDQAEEHLRREALAHGIDGDRRLVFTDLAPWVNHTFVKRAADLVLDTSLKNGHTTLIDALCAGVPVVTLEGARMSNRAGSSALHSLELHELTVHSIKEYVDVAVELATNHALLRRLRSKLEAHRLQYPLFDTERYTTRFSAAIKSAWHVTKSNHHTFNSHQPSGFRSMHVFPVISDVNTITPRYFPILSALGDDETYDEYEMRVASAIDEGESVLLHIGGHTARPGWWIVNIDDREHVDFVLSMDKLYAFPDSSVTALYASHVLEHCHYGVYEDVRHTLDEWFRVLKPGGALYVAVPDLSVLSTLFVNETISEQDRFYVMRMMYGGQVDEFDVHKVGFNFAILATYLQNAGFCEIKRVRDFGLFVDSSVAEFRSKSISLNVVARACKPGDWIDVTLKASKREGR